MPKTQAVLVLTLALAACAPVAEGDDMTQDDFRRIQAEARATMQTLAKIYPGAFTPDGKPIVAEARLLPPLPAPKETQA